MLPVPQVPPEKGLLVLNDPLLHDDGVLAREQLDGIDGRPTDLLAVDDHVTAGRRIDGEGSLFEREVDRLLACGLERHCPAARRPLASADDGVLAGRQLQRHAALADVLAVDPKGQVW